MDGQVVELTEAEQAQHQLQMEQQLKSFWAKQLLEMEQLEVGSEQGPKRTRKMGTKPTKLTYFLTCVYVCVDVSI